MSSLSLSLKNQCLAASLPAFYLAVCPLIIFSPSTYAANFPQAGNTVTYNNINDAFIDGGNTNPPATPVLSSDNAQTTMIIDGILLTIRNFNLTNDTPAAGPIRLTNNSTLSINTLNNASVLFSNNQYLAASTGRGGVIYNDGSTLDIKNNVSFNNNKLTSATPSSQLFGGVLYNNNAQATMGDNAIFNGNSIINITQNVAGGAIYNANSTLTIGNNVHFVENFLQNQASTSEGGGGAIYNIANSTLNIGREALFERNDSNRQGGALFNQNASVSIGNQGIFRANQALGSGATGRGGAIYNLNGRTEIRDDTTFENNTAFVSGGAIYNRTNGIIEFTIGDNARFYDNHANSLDGGAIDTNNILKIGNGAIFVGNRAGGNGGAINLENNSQLTIGRDAVFESGMSGVTGGAISSSAIGSIITLGDNIRFIRNNTSGSGGAIRLFESNLTINKNSQFEENISANTGGAIDTISQSISFIDENATFNHNNAVIGGALSNTNSTITLAKNAIFSTNNADNGGAIFNTNDARLIIGSGASFLNNTTTNMGGAILNLLGSQITLQAQDNTTTLFSGNHSIVGNNAITFDAGESLMVIENAPSSASASALLDMRDPMYVSNLLAPNLLATTINIAKNDAGVWALGGDNNFNLAERTNFSINAGTLYLYAANEVVNPSATDAMARVGTGVLNLGGRDTVTPSTFTLASGVTLTAGGDNAINLGNGNLLIGDNATIRGGSPLRSLGGSSPRSEQGGTTSLTLTSDNNTQLQGLVNLQALADTDVFTLDASLVDAPNATGQVVKSGLGTLISNNVWRYSGDTLLAAGTWVMNGELQNQAQTTVAPGTTLKGTGTLNSTTVNGTIAPGNSIGTLTVNGNYVQNPGSTYEVEINPQGQSDLINVTGTATINGGSVSVIKEAGTYTPQRYTIVTAAGGRSGTYDALVQMMPFLDIGLTYDANNVYLDVTRSVNNFASTAITNNQRDVATAVESLGMGNPVYDALLNATGITQAQLAFNTLSGELYSSLLSRFVEESRYARQAVLQRLSDGNMQERVKRLGSRYLWAQGYGSWGDVDGTSNTARVDSQTQGLFMGADMQAAQHTLGVMAGYSNSQLKAPARLSTAKSDNYTLGLYGRHDAETFIAKMGAAYTWQQFDVHRQAQLPTFSENLKGSHTAHTAHTAQVFGQLNLVDTFTALHLQPFIGATYVTTDSRRWQEAGIAGLTGHNHFDTFYTHLGVEQGQALIETPTTVIRERVMLAWRHAYTGVYPLSTFAFTSGGNPFAIQGAPIAKDALVMDLGVDAALPQKGLNMRLAYIGQVGSQVQDHGLTGRVSWQFD